MNQALVSFVSVRSAPKLNELVADGVVLVTSFKEPLCNFPEVAFLHEQVEEFKQLNASAEYAANLLRVDKGRVPGGRLILSGTGLVTSDFDDVRAYQQAGERGMKLALSAGVKNPLLVTIPSSREGYEKAELVSALGALQPLYAPYNIRLSPSFLAKTLFVLPLASVSKPANENLVNEISAISSSFDVCRDIGEQGPMIMHPRTVWEYVYNKFRGLSPFQDITLTNYPLMLAVSRASQDSEDQRARLIRLEYKGGNDIKKTYIFVAKGTTMDTGGCNLKTGGTMFGMSRAKYGSAVLAGLFEALQTLKPQGIKVIGYLCMVRNNVGSKAYTCDEVLTARNGKRIHIYNTDYEGRVAMLDALITAKEEALKELDKDPHIITLATMTEHQAMSYGSYATVMDNGPARDSGWSEALQKLGDEFGQPIEIARLHPEDYTFHKADGNQADARNGNNKPSTQNKRGHQSPGAFLIMGSGLDEHGLDSPTKKPIKFSHIDMAGCQGEAPKTTYPNPLLTLIAGLVLKPQEKKE